MRVTISYCLPVHNRTHDLKKIMPHLIELANYSPPMELCVLNYNSPDDLHDYMTGIIKGNQLIGESCFTYCTYTGRNYYHMAHARNLSVLMSHGEFVSIISADVYPTLQHIDIIREKIDEGYDWMYPLDHPAAMTIKKQEFIAAGGYDERFEFYGPEDKDLHRRLERRNVKSACLPRGLFVIIPTPNEIKIRNYREPLGKRAMAHQMHGILEENTRNQVLVANPNGWGAWE